MPCLNVNLFWLQCPARWTHLQAVVTPGSNPLPTEVRIKRHRDDEVAKTFFFMDQNSWEQIKHLKHFLHKMYMDPVQLQVRILVGRSIIMAFALFKYFRDPDENNFVPKLDGPHDACIIQILDIVNAQKELCVAEIQEAITNGTSTQDFLDRFKETFSRITSGFIAKQVLGRIGIHMAHFWVRVFAKQLPCWLV